MLSTENRRSVAGYNLFQDNQDKNLYHYLPSEKVRIADNGSKLHYTAFFDGTVKDEESGNSRTSGGLLVLETELGPTEEELSAIQKELGADVKLVPVLIESGDAELIMFGKGGKDDTPDDKMSVRMFGHTTPSLCGKQTAAFSVLLGDKESQVMWNLLHNTPQTQIVVKYELNYNGLRPAYYLKIEVDFEATDEYWRHHFDADLDFKYAETEQEGKNKEDISVVVAADVDVDVMLRDLMTQGAIKVYNIDYTTDGSEGTLTADSPGIMSIVKELLSGELFNVTPLPSEDYSALKNEKTPDKKEGEQDGKPGETPTKPDASKPEAAKPDASKPDTSKPEKTDPTAAVKDAKKSTVNFSDEALKHSKEVKDLDAVVASKPILSSIDNPDSEDIPIPSDADFSQTDDGETTVLLEDFDAVDTNDDGKITEDEWEKANYPKEDYKELLKKEGATADGISEKTYNEYKKDKEAKAEKDKIEKRESNDSASRQALANQAAQSSDKVTTMHFTADMKIGYTYKKSTDKVHTKRTYVFDKQKAQKYQYCPQGILSTKDTEFNPDEQVAIVRLWEGPFSQNELIFSAPLNFDALGITEIGVELSIPYDDEIDHTVKMRKSDKAIRLTKAEPVQHFTVGAAPFSEKRRGIDYTVRFSFDSQSDFVGFPVQHPTFEVSFTNVFDTYRQIDATLLEELTPRIIQAGGISFEEEGCKRADVLLYDVENDPDHALRTFRIEKGTQPKTILLNGAKEYKTAIEYTLQGGVNQGKISGIPCTGNKVKCIDRGSKQDDIIVEDPDRGVLLVHLRRGADTFGNGIDQVTVTLRQGEKPESVLTLYDTRPSMYYLFDPDSEDDIEVVSIEVERDNGDIESFEPKQRTLPVNGSFELLLNIK